MAINLRKGQKIDLTKGGSGLKHVMVGLGWDAAEQGSGFLGLFKKQQTIDCDASVILCGENGKLVPGKHCLIYYGNLSHPSGAIVHQGDNLTGDGEGDDEQIMVDLGLVPANVARLIFVVNIYDADKKGQDFGKVKNAFIRLVDKDTFKEFCRFNLSENYQGMTGLIVGEIYRRNGEWRFSAIGQPVRDASRLNNLLALFA